ncbi:MAG: NAD(P)/FAD-dependent oxidoreductase [Acidimicrobiia bacterium]|nr:NAD(P)/FAD-dependent oxidoreductase [Acidimicrobiia bacterium]
MTGPTSFHDVVVVGARCAGAATAMLLARLGHDVVVVDRASFPSDTVSTHAVARGGVVQLSRWGLLDDVLASGAPAIREVSFHRNGVADVRAVKDSAGIDVLVNPRRYVLDTILLEAAARAGAEVRTGVTVTDVVRDATGRVIGVTGHDDDRRPVTLRGRIVVGADGLGSRIARAVGAPVIDRRHDRGSLRYAYYEGVGHVDGGFGRTELHLGDGLFGGVFPTHDGLANVWVSGLDEVVGARAGSRVDPHADFVALVEAADPELAERLRAGRPASQVRVFRHMPNQLRQPVGPGWALVGDAGYFRDALPGYGITDAFRDAEQLAVAIDRAFSGEALVDAALAGFQAARDAAVADIFTITVALSEQPPADRFVELQRSLASAIEAQALEMAAWPQIPNNQTKHLTGATQ